MLERLAARGEELCRKRAGERGAHIAARLGEAAAGVAVAADGDAVVLSGRKLARRYDASPALRWRIAEIVDER